MGKKFDTIYESVVSRYQVGGYLPGDIVKFRPNYKSCDCYNSMSSIMKSELDSLASCGLNIRVTQVGDKFGGVTGANQHKTADSVVITVAADHGGGRSYGGITVKPEMIDHVSSDEFAPKVPDEFYRKDDTTMEPEEYKADSKNITRVTDKGNGKNTPTDLKLAGESVMLTKDTKNIANIITEMYQ